VLQSPLELKGASLYRHARSRDWGNRRCLGAGFATVEMRVVLREILRRAELCTTTAAGEHQKVKHVIFVPHRGARIAVKAIRDVPSVAQAATQTLAR
jgi:hypothetical protein